MENQERVTHSYRSRDKEIDAKKYPWFCFAAKGLSYIGRISILFLWKDTRNRNRRDWVGVNDLWTPTEEWSYQCINMADTVRNPNITWIANDMHEKSKIKVQDIILNTGSKKG